MVQSYGRSSSRLFLGRSQGSPTVAPGLTEGTRRKVRDALHFPVGYVPPSASHANCAAQNSRLKLGPLVRCGSSAGVTQPPGAAGLLAGPQPNRTGVLEAEGGAAQRCSTHCRAAPEAHRQLVRLFAPEECANYFRHGNPSADDDLGIHKDYEVLAACNCPLFVVVSAVANERNLSICN